MINKTLKYIEQEFLSETDIISNTAKTRMLNVIDSELTSLIQLTTDSTILDSIMTLKNIVEDSYNLTMYKFQFKLLTLSLNKEIQNLKDIIRLS